MAMIKLYLLVACGGALGAMARFGVAHVMVAYFGRGFPYATLTVNVLGSLAMGGLYAAIQHEMLWVPWRNIIGVGFLGAFTTFSTFSLDTLLLLQQGDWLKAGLNMVLNLGVCLFAAWVGLSIVNAKVAI